MFHNPLSRFDVPSYSIHVDRRAHVSFHEAAIANQLLILGTLSVDTPGLFPLSWQKITTSWADHPNLFYQIQMCLLEVWHAEVGRVFTYFA